MSLFGGFYGWCLSCSRVMFHNLRFRRYIQGGLRAVARCEECGTSARLVMGDRLRVNEDGHIWQEYHRL